MYKRILCALVVVLGLLFSSLGCGSLVSDDTVTLAQFDPVKAIANKLAAKEAIWDSYGAEITALKARPQASPATDLTDVNNKITALQTKTSDNTTIARLQEAIDRIDNKLKGSNPIISTTPTNTSQVATQAGGTVTMRIYTNPSNALVYPGYTDPVVTAAGSYTWFIQFMNTDVVYHKFYLVGSMNPTTIVSATNTGVIDNSPTGTSMTWTPNFQTDKTAFTTLRNPNINNIDITQNVFFTSEAYCVLSPGQVILIPVTLKLGYATTGAGYYMVSFNPNVQSYP
jgi:hypothetical protein